MTQEDCQLSKKGRQFIKGTPVTALDSLRENLGYLLVRQLDPKSTCCSAAWRSSKEMGCGDTSNSLSARRMTGRRPKSMTTSFNCCVFYVDACVRVSGVPGTGTCAYFHTYVCALQCPWHNPAPGFGVRGQAKDSQARFAARWLLDALRCALQLCLQSCISREILL